MCPTLDPDGNPLLKAKFESKSSYFVELLSALEDIQACAGQDAARNYAETKLQTQRKSFDEDSYIQGAVELAVVRYFAQEFPKDFEYEPKLGAEGDQNVECSVRVEKTQLNVEVKVSRHDRRFKIEDAPGMKLRAYGRVDGFAGLVDELKPILTDTDSGTGDRFEPQVSFRQDLTMFDHLVSAHKKFASSNPVEHCNILFVGCGDSDDIQDCDEYLTGPTGLFTGNSIRSPVEFARVDLVFLTSLYYKHSTRYGKLDAKSWRLADCFVLGFPNPFAEKQKYEAMKVAFAKIPSLTEEFRTFYLAKRDHILDPFFLKHFIHGELCEKQRRCYF